MKIQRQDYDEVSVIDLQGEFVSDYIKPFQDTVSSALADGSAGIVLDLSSITFIDSHCLEQLLWLRDYCLENQSQLKIAGLDETCAKILEITRLDAEFDSYDEVSRAVKSFV
ncbi:anti-anti-sigma factor [Anaerohalosphaera lusitana]|uniref:Anti-anti-sigma factor n=1 Tax=Anaerohalosphaera lusitana TaxID=1936003 RepID=A0A1U9NMT1_9BACT|nr:STAS domain-containing protein [Anaerohalosphaera lusitana]AQT68910.1 anti-anti-sigma factor [Anaerohalosphaera lusitana]